LTGEFSSTVRSPYSRATFELSTTIWKATRKWWCVNWRDSWQIKSQSTQLNSDYPPFIPARFGVLPCHGAVVCVVPKHNFCSECLNLTH
jgi:hypothetical protein